MLWLYGDAAEFHPAPPLHFIAVDISSQTTHVGPFAMEVGTELSIFYEYDPN